MKKIIIILICFTLFGCSTVEENKTKPSKETEIINTNEPIVTQKHNLKNLDIGNNWAIEGSDDFEVLNNVIKLNDYENANIYYDGLYLDIGDVTFGFNISDNTAFTFELYDDENNLIFNQDITSSNDVIEYHSDKELYSAIIRISNIISNDGYFEISNFNIKRSKDIVNVHINQVGYMPKQRKVAIFPGHNGNYFDIKDAKTNKIVATFPLSQNTYSEYTDEYVAYGEFTDFNLNGEYYLESSFGFKSYNFEINDNVYGNLLKEVINSFTLQRCGMEISEELSLSMAHDACHIDLAKIYYHNTPIDVTGGWHDAGDYGRYVDTGFKALSDLLIAYIDNNNKFDDDTNKINSNNGVVDLLDEIKYELDWMMKMQDESGGVHMVASSMHFADIVSPEDDKEDVIVFDISPISTAEFSSIMALASYVYKDIDKEYSDKCLDKSLKAYEFAMHNNYEKNMPSEYHAGRYAKTNLEYYRYYMGIALWYATDDKQYYDYAMTQYNSNNNDLYILNWNPLLFYPSYLVLKKANSSFENYNLIKDRFIGHANYQSEMINNNIYRNNLNDVLTWGSNQIVADNAMQLMMAYNLTNNLEYYDNATELLDYLLGKNCLNKSFITGYGDDYPKNLHHRTTMSKDTYFKGVLVGGPNMSMEDKAMYDSFNNQNKKAQWMYLDDINSYSTNETAIQYNSSLIYLISNIK